jgi:outer membrane protein TolC
LAHRPELQKARLQIIESRMGVDSARSEYLPTVDAHGRYYHADPDFKYSRHRENWVVGVILNWDLFSGLSTPARVNKAEGVLQEMLAADRKTTLSVQLDLKTSYLRLSEAMARLAVTEASVAQAEESLHLVERQYEGGSATITRYLDTELARNRARMGATAAFYDREKATAAVGRALGYWVEYVQETRNEHE